jgi:hypothetical protein
MCLISGERTAEAVLEDVPEIAGTAPPAWAD